MSDSNANGIDSTKQNKKDENHADAENIISIQKEETGKSSQSKTKVIPKSGEVTWREMNKTELAAPLADSKDTVIDIEDKLLHLGANKKAAWFNHQELHIKNFLTKGLRKPQKLQQIKYQESKAKTWVQFSFGGVSRGYGDDSSRQPFILLVLIIVMIMLFFTGAWLVVVFQSPELYEIFADPSLFILIGAFGGMMIIYYIMMCVPAARKPPCSFIMLVLTVIFNSLLAAVVTCRYRTVIVFYALITTFVVVFVCALLACSSFDFTSFLLYFVVISVAFSVVCICIFIGMMATGLYMKTLHLVILIISVCMQSVGLVMELQMILGGKSIQLSESDYAMGAFMLYTSIVKMFLNIVQAFGISDD